MKRLSIITIVIICSSIVFKAEPQKHSNNLPKTKVAVLVECENKTVEIQITNAVKKFINRKENLELIHDFMSPSWDFLIHINSTEIKYESGEKANAVTMGTAHYEKIPIEHFKAKFQPLYKDFPAIRLPSESHVSYYPIEDIETYSKAVVSIFNGYRKFHHNLENTYR